MAEGKQKRKTLVTHRNKSKSFTEIRQPKMLEISWFPQLTMSTCLCIPVSIHTELRSLECCHSQKGNTPTPHPFQSLPCLSNMHSAFWDATLSGFAAVPCRICCGSTVVSVPPTAYCGKLTSKCKVSVIDDVVAQPALEQACFAIPQGTGRQRSNAPEVPRDFMATEFYGTINECLHCQLQQIAPSSTPKPRYS